MFWEFQMLHFKLRLGLVQKMFCHNNLAGLVELGCSLLPCFLKMVSRQWCMRVPSRPRLDLVWTVIFDLATKGLRCGVLNGEWLFARSVHGLCWERDLGVRFHAALVPGTVIMLSCLWSQLYHQPFVISALWLGNWGVMQQAKLFLQACDQYTLYYIRVISCNASMFCVISMAEYGVKMH